MRQYSLRRQLLGMVLVMTVVLTAIFGAVLYHLDERGGQNRAVEQHQWLTSHLEQIEWLNTQNDTAHYFLPNTPDAWQDFTQRAQVPDRHGWERPEDLPDGVALGKNMRGMRLEERHGTRWIITYLPQEDGYLVTAFYPVKRRVVFPLLGLSAVALFIGLAHLRMITRYVIKPLDKLKAYAGAIASHCWQEPLSTDYSAQEVAELTKAMNDMQSQLRRIEAEQQAFLQSISHDLKTPVAVIMAHAQAILDGVYVDAPENNAIIIQEEAKRLADKIRKILTYNTLEHMLYSTSPDAITEAGELLTALAAHFQALSPAINWQVQTEVLYLAAERENLRVAIENILDNALRYAQSTVSLKGHQDGPYAIITITNDGEAIAPERLERIFDRLNKDKSGNFGLGLFISRKIIHYYGGTIWAENTAEGVCFAIRLPQAVRRP